MTAYVSVIFAVIGLIVYLISQAPKPTEIGRIMFWVGLLAFLLRVGPETFSLFGR